MTCQGHKPMLALGDIMIPPHDLGIATGYDDAYNQTPARLLRSIRGLGYRGSVIHYIGMSHFFPLAPSRLGSSWSILALPAMNTWLSLAWHTCVLRWSAQAMGYSVILSQSFELLAQHCPDAWQQRTRPMAIRRGRGMNRHPRPAVARQSGRRVGWMQNGWRASWSICRRMLPCRCGCRSASPGGGSCPTIGSAFTMRRPTAALGGNPIVIDTMAAKLLSPAQIALLDQAGALLAVRHRPRSWQPSASKRRFRLGSEALLLAYPADGARSRHARSLAGQPSDLAWAAPAFDVLQIEEYDWVTARCRRACVQFGADHRSIKRLGYAPAQRHYLAGYVADAGHGRTPLAAHR